MFKADNSLMFKADIFNNTIKNLRNEFVAIPSLKLFKMLII